MRIALAALLTSACLTACASNSNSRSGATPGSSANSARISPTTRPGKTLVPGDDPCAARLHELCGVLLLYYVKHQDLPPTLDDLKQAPGAAAVGDFTCPVSHKPYVYTPAGIPSPAGPAALMILYDAEPSHSGARLAISVTPPVPGGPLVPQVILAPESRFPRRRPTTLPQ